MRKLIEIFDTKYFPAHYDKDLQYFISLALDCLKDYSKQIISDHESVKEAIESFRNRGVIELDLADAHFVPNTMAIIQDSAEKGVILCDTANVTRDDILTENRRRAKLEYTTEPLPELRSINDLPNYIAFLSEDVVYTPGDMPISMSIPLVALITVFKPSVQIDMESNYEKLFQYVNNNIILEDFVYSEYFYVVGNTIYRQKFNGDKIYVQGSGELSYQDFRKNFLTLPTIFGSKVLASDKDWEILQHAAIDDIRSCLKMRSITITDIYPRR